MSKQVDLDGAAKNWDIIKADWRAVRHGWRYEKAEQEGWSHQYMQRLRTLARRGPVLTATLLGLGGPLLLIIAGVGYLR